MLQRFHISVTAMTSPKEIQALQSAESAENYLLLDLMSL